MVKVKVKAKVQLLKLEVVLMLWNLQRNNKGFGSLTVALPLCMSRGVGDRNQKCGARHLAYPKICCG